MISKHINQTILFNTVKIVTTTFLCNIYNRLCTLDDMRVLYVLEKRIIINVASAVFILTSAMFPDRRRVHLSV